MGRYIVLTATHCVSDVPKTIQVNGKACDVWQIVNDGADHALVTVGSKCPQMHTASLTIAAKAGRQPRVGTRIFIWGNPYMFSDILRFGHVAGHQDNAMPGLGRAQLLDYNGFSGDSGAAIFDMRGRIVAVVSIGSAPYRLMGSFPLKFTRKQWREAGL